MGPQLLHPRCAQGSFEVIRRYLKEKARFETSPLQGGEGRCVCVCVCVCVRGGEGGGIQSMQPRCMRGSFEVIRRYLKEKARFET